MSNPSPKVASTNPICVLQCLDNRSYQRSCDSCEKLRNLETQLADARKLVLSLENERIALRSSIAEKNDPITTNLPPEITSHIFQIYVHLHPEETNKFQILYGFREILPGAALRLGAVCRKWRTISWSTPQLWTTLSVNLLSKGHAHGPDLVEQWFERTKGLEVDVRLHTGRDHHWHIKGHSEGDAESTMKALNQFLSQIRCLDMDALPFSIASKLRGLGPEATSQLQRLCLGSGPGGDYRDVESSYKAHPSLFSQRSNDEHESPHCPTHVSLRCAVPFYQLNIRWTRLTDIYLGGVSRATSFYIIEAATQTLTHLTMVWISDEDETDVDMDEWLPASPIELPSLLTLHIGESFSHPGFTATVFNSINAPSLRSLRYNGCDEERPMPVDALIACIQRSSCSIEQLVLDWPGVIDATEIVRILHETPALDLLNLRLTSNLPVDPIFFLLAQRDGGSGQSSYLRNLRILHLHVFPPIDWMLFMDIWLARPFSCSNHPNAESHISASSTDDLLHEQDFKVDLAGKNLSVTMLVRGELDPPEQFVSKLTLTALINLSTNLHGYICVDEDGKTSREVWKKDVYDLLERLFLHHFPADSELLPLLRSMSKRANI
ncbi:hypothetical protein D9619_012348 [Psilocybe cf. subviscida]|uniref:F-box domain-containing protein n=1 Tax=Psilocybe cf. subviscida TaxID=2480587 RepID=A0A8H5ARG9_9AGAR|nr:hypothetical protein D9619_012348 [Psilocybe cf. subviscida]